MQFNRAILGVLLFQHHALPRIFSRASLLEESLHPLASEKKLPGSAWPFSLPCSSRVVQSGRARFSFLAEDVGGVGRGPPCWFEPAARRPQGSPPSRRAGFRRDRSAVYVSIPAPS